MRHFVRSIAVIGAAAISASCTLEPPVAPAPDVEDTTFATGLGVDLTKMTKTASGLYYQDLTVGAGVAAVSGNHVTVHYTGFLSNGSTFDTSIGKVPFGFTIGQSEVIKGWDEGVVGIRVGGTRRLVIPASLGYGPVQNGAIPANSVLVFIVQLVSIP